MIEPTPEEQGQAAVVSRALSEEVYCRHGKTHQPAYNCEVCTAKVVATALTEHRERWYRKGYENGEIAQREADAQIVDRRHEETIEALGEHAPEGWRVDGLVTLAAAIREQE